MSAQIVPSLTGDERLQIAKLFLALEGFAEIRDTMPLQYVRAFLLVCGHEGAGVSEIGAMANVAQSVASRHLQDLGEKNRHGEPGFGLVEQDYDPLNRRKHKVALTPKGAALAKRMARVLQCSR